MDDALASLPLQILSTCLLEIFVDIEGLVKDWVSTYIVEA